MSWGDIWQGMARGALGDERSERLWKVQDLQRCRDLLVAEVRSIPDIHQLSGTLSDVLPFIMTKSN
jgi:hypothetical protein